MFDRQIQKFTQKPLAVIAKFFIKLIKENKVKHDSIKKEK